MGYSRRCITLGLAKAISISEGYDSGRDLLSFEVTIYMEEGIWHIADPTATYLMIITGVK